VEAAAVLVAAVAGVTGMVKTLALLVALSLMLVPQLATAQDADCDDVESCAREGARLFQDGHFREAAIYLRAAYDLEPVSVLLYNIARAYQQDGRCAQSNRFFTDYLDSGDTQAASQAAQYAPDEATCARRHNDLMSQADSAVSAGDLQEAGQFLADALELSDEPNARIMYGQTLFLLGRCQDAEAFLDDLVGEIDMTSAQRREMENDLERSQRCIADRRCDSARNACEAERLEIDEAHQASVAASQDTGVLIAAIGGGVLAIAMLHDILSQGTIDDFEAAGAAGDENEFDDLKADVESAQSLSLILYGLGLAGGLIGVIVYTSAGGPSPAADTDCSGVCWDWGLDVANADAGFWLGGEF
jgi:tetratricopeptide (TPR) repeat protein